MSLLVEGMRFVMGTFLTIRVEATDLTVATKVRDQLFHEIQRLEVLLSIYYLESDISKINRAAGITPVHVNPDTYEVIERALLYANLSEGAFDPVVPTHNGMNYRNVLLNIKEKTVFLCTEGMQLDLGGIGKGYALDRALSLVRNSSELKKVTMDFGGQLLFWSPEGTFEPTTIGIENPKDRQTILSTFQIQSNSSISTSSNTEQKHHLRDPRTGKPAQGVSSVTVVAATGVEAEALSTALFVLGPHRKSVLLEKYPYVRVFFST